MSGSPQVTFQIGPGIIFCVPITQTDHLLNGIFMIKLNTCKTYDVIDKVDHGGYNQRINEIMQDFLNNQEITNLFVNLKPVINNLIKYIRRKSILTTIQRTSEDSRCFVMNFVGNGDDDQVGVNENEDYQLINLFLKETNKECPYKSYNLPVLIDNGGSPISGRDMSIQECLITSSLASYFQKNNFPFKVTDDRNIDYFVFQNEEINNLDSDDRSKRFLIIHYIQSLFTSIMILYIDESPQTREIIFDNIQNLINEFVIESSWLSEKQNNEAVSFLIEKIFFNAQLIQIIDFDSIKKLAIEIYQSLEFSDHVTQIEFIKLPKSGKRIANGFMIKNGYFYLPLINILTSFHKELNLDLNSPLFGFLSTIEKHTSQIATKNLLLTDFIDPINKDDWEIAIKDFDNMDTQERANFIKNYNQEIQDLLLGISAKSFNEIDCLSNESFVNVLPNNLSDFSADEQFQLFFENEKNRFKFISIKQLKIIKPQVFSLLNNAVKQNKINRQNLNEFIQINGLYFTIDQLLPIEFELLEIQNQTIFLIKVINGSCEQIQKLDLSKCQSEILQVLIEKKLNDLSIHQKKSLDLQKLNKKSQRLFVKQNFDEIEKKQFETINFYYFNDDERIQFIENKFEWANNNQLLALNYQKLKEEKPNLYDDIKQHLFEHSTNHDSMIFYLYLFHSKKFEINEFVIPQMSESFKIIYINNHANEIQKEYQSLFFISIEAIFENSDMYRDELLSIIINKWDHELIKRLINFIDLNEFPKKCLYDLIYFYSDDLQSNKINDFHFNELNQIIDTEKRLFIFQYFINYYISNNKLDLIRKIKIRNFNIQEIEFLLVNALKYLIPDQVIQINLNQISHSLLVNLVKEKILSMSQNQIQSLNVNDIELISIVIQSKRSDYLAINQIKSLNLTKLKLEKDIKDLINSKIDGKFIFEYLCDDQIKKINFILVRVNAQKDFLSSKGHLLEKEQIQQIPFKKGQKSIDMNIQLLRYLNKCDKLIFLDEIQVQNLVDIFDSKNFDEISNIFKSTAFASFYTNKHATQINDQIIQTLDLNNIEPHFLVYLIRFKIKIFLPEQVRQVDFAKLDKNLLNIWFKNFPEFDSSENLWCQLITEKVLNLPIEKLREIEISIIRNDILNIVLEIRIDDLNDSQIHAIDTSYSITDTYLIKKKFNILTNEQKFKMPLSELNSENQASFFCQLIKQDAFLLKFLDKNEIHKIDLTKLQKYTEGYLSLLISNELSIEQYMTIDWMKNDEHDRMNIALINFFLKLKLTNDENFKYLKRILISNINEQINERIFEQSPNAYKVSFLNTKILNTQAIDINLEKNFIPDAIKTMFMNSKYYLVSVQFIINKWIHLYESISKFIDALAIQNDFSEETIQNLLSEKYLFHLKRNQIQYLNISNVQSEYIEYALKNRAVDFLNLQIQNSNCIDKEIITDQLENLRKDEKIPSLNLVELHIILINFIFNKKFHLLKYNKINELLLSRVNELEFNHLKKLNFTKLTSESLNHVFHERMNDITETEFDQLDANDLNKLNSDNLFNLLNKFQRKLTKKLVKQLNVSNSRVAAFFLINCENLITDQHIQSMDLIETSSIIQEIIGKSAFDIIKEKNRYRDLSETQLNQVDYSDINNVRLILECGKEKYINLENCQKINMKEVNNLNDDLKTNLIRSRISLCSKAQIQDLIVTNVKIIEPIIENSLSNVLLECQIQRINVKELKKVLLAKLIIEKLFFFSRAQMKEENVKYILKNQTKSDVLATLGDEQKITQFQSYHIVSISMVSNRVISLLIIYHCKNLSTEQIQNITKDKWDKIDRKIHRMCKKSALSYIIQAHKLKDFNDKQFNNLIDYTDLLCIKEILYEKLENQIIKENAEKIRILDVYNNLSESEFLHLFKSCYLKFSRDQIRSLNLSFLNNKDDLLTSFIINRISYLNSDQMKEEYVINTIKSLNSEDIVKMLNDENNKKFVEFYHISNIDITSDNEVSKIIVGYYPKYLKEEHVQSLNLDLNLIIRDIDGNKKKILDILIAENKLVYFSVFQLNTYIDYSNTQHMIEILKNESLFDKIDAQNAQKINTNRISERLDNKQCLWKFLKLKINDFSNAKLKTFNLENSMIAKIFRENKIIHRLNNDQKFKFYINELISCDFTDLSHFFFPGKKGSYIVAIGIMLYRNFNGEYLDNERNQIESWLEQNESKNNEFNEIYFANCIKIANQKLHLFAFENISSNFFEFYDKIGKKIKFNIMYHMTCKRFTNECKNFGITPIDLKNIIKEKYENTQDKKVFKEELSKIISPFLFYSYMGSEYQNELKIFMKSITTI